MKLNQIDIVPFELNNRQEDLLSFLDDLFGKNYYTSEKLKIIYDHSFKEGHNCSFVAYYHDQIVGMRFTHAPGTQWHVLFKENELSTDLWPAPMEDTAYFKTIGVHRGFHKMGIAKSLSNKSLEVLKQLNTKSVVAHSWVESPNNASMAYLTKMGFTPIKEHKGFWSEDVYQCDRCGDPPCRCTAMEVALNL